MRLFLTSDSHWESKVDKVLDTFYKAEYKKYFAEKSYGDLISCIAIVLMCQDPGLNLKQRIRYAKKEKTIYLDIMLDLNRFINIDQTEREREVAQRIITEVPAIIGKYKLDDFSLSKFEINIKEFFGQFL